MTLKNSSWIQVFETNGANSSVTSAVYVDEAADTKDVQFEVYDLSQKVDAYTEVSVPIIGYSGKYHVQFRFDTATIISEGPAEPTEPADPVDPPEPNDPPEPSDPGVTDGEYVIDYVALRADNDTPSSMDSRFEKPGTLKVENGKMYVSIALSNSEHVTGLELQRADGSWSAYNTDFRVVDFDLTDLTVPINARVSMRVPLPNGNVYENTKPFRIALDADSAAKKQQIILDVNGTAALNNVDYKTVIETNYEGHPIRITVPAGSTSLSVSEFDIRADELLVTITVGGWETERSP